MKALMKGFISASTFMLLGIFSTASNAEQVSVSGTITNYVTQQPVAGAVVSLGKYPSMTATTNASGAYSLSGSVAVMNTPIADNLYAKPFFKHNRYYFSARNDREPVKITLYTVTGRTMTTLMNSVLNAGNYCVNACIPGMSAQLYFIRIQQGEYTAVTKIRYFKSNNSSSDVSFFAVTPQVQRQQRTLRPVRDTIIVTATNYRTVRMQINNYNGQHDTTIKRSDIVQGRVSIASVSPKGMTRGINLAGQHRVFTQPTLAPGFINSGAPDFLQVTMKRIDVTSGNQTKTIWRGSKVLRLEGDGVLNLSDLFLDSVPQTPITQISLILNDRALIKGTLIGSFNFDTTNQGQITRTDTFYTKANRSYNASDSSGGATASQGRYLAFKSSPAESTYISLSAGHDADTNMSPIATTIDYTYDSTVVPNLSILFDLSRLLRFYNGCNLSHTGGVNPSDPADRAYFFCHSMFSQSVATFFGQMGAIQGYQTTFSWINSGNNYGVLGWMTIICNPGGNILSGILSGDDDNALTIAKGRVTSVTADTAFHYDISNVDIDHFTKKNSLNDSTFVTWHQLAGTGQNPNPERTGEARFTLRFKTQ